jgi:hypothetical protein
MIYILFSSHVAASGKLPKGAVSIVLQSPCDPCSSKIPLTYMRQSICLVQYPVAASGGASQHSWRHTGQRLEAGPVSGRPHRLQPLLAGSVHCKHVLVWATTSLLS